MYCWIPARLVAGGGVLVSGYTADYQPARRLVPAPALAADSSLQLLCSSGDCFALLTWDTACISRGRHRDTAAASIYLFT